MRFEITAITAAALLVGTSASAAPIVSDPGFDIDFTDTGENFTQADVADFDKWVFLDDGADKEWLRPLVGGNPGAYASGAFNGNNYRRTLFQGITDNKSSTGLVDLTFDLNLSDGGSDNGPFSVAVWGVANLGDSFDLVTRNQDMSANDGNAILLASESYTDDTNGWESQLIAGINLGTGYDLVIIGVRSLTHDNTDPDIAGVDNFSFVVPEPGSLVLAACGLGMLVGRRRIQR